MKLKRIEIRNLWGKDVLWDFKEDVNILIGINGSGKSTILELIEEALSSKKEEDIDYRKFDPIDEMILELEDGLIIQINSEERKINNLEAWGKINLSVVNTFDIPQKSYNPKASSLDFEIEQLQKAFITYQRNYLSKHVEDILKKGNGEDANEKIKKLQNIISNKDLFLKKLNELFKETGKSFDEDEFNFKLKGAVNPIEPTNLSSGEKQILIILLKTFLQEKQPFIYLLDEPEISLHITWQRKIINFLRELNPNCQLILVTHSATVFYLNWESKVFRMEEIAQKSNLLKSSSILNSSNINDAQVFDNLKQKFQSIKQQERNNKGRQLYYFNIELNRLAVISGNTAQKILDFLKTERIIPDVVTLTTLISKITTLTQANKIFKNFQSLKIYPNQITLNMLLKKVESVTKGINLISDVKKKHGVYPDIITFSTLLGKAKNTNEVDNVEEARKYYNVPTNERYLTKLKLKR